MKKKVIDRSAIKRAAARSTQESAYLEQRTVPVGYVRSKKTERYLAERRQRA